MFLTSFAIVWVSLGTQPAVEDVIAGIADREGALKNFSFHLRAAQYEEEPDFVKGRWDVEVTAEAAGRCRIEGKHESIRATESEPVVAATNHELQVFDGKNYRRAYGEAAFTHGVIASARHRMQMPFDPLELATNYNGRRINECLNDDLRHKTALRLTEAEYGGRRMLSIETGEVRGPDGRLRKERFLVDPDRAFLFCRCEQMLRDGEGGDWQTSYLRELSDFVEVEANLWLPRRMISTLNAVPVGEKAKMEFRTIADIDHWVVNRALPDVTFEFEFPDGVFVSDEINGQTYFTSLVTDADVSQQVEAANATVSTWRAAIYVAAVAAILLALIALAAFHKRRPKPHDGDMR